MVFRPVWPFPSNSVWEDPPGHTDTPFLHPQTLYYASHTEATQTGEEGGVRQAEQRNFSDPGGIQMGVGGGCIVKKMWAHLPLACTTIQMRLPFLKHTHTMVPIPAAKPEQGEKPT